MASRNTKSELKVSKRRSVPSAAKSDRLLAKEGPELLGKQEDTPRKEVSLSRTTKPHYPKSNMKVRDKRWKGTNSIEKKVNHRKKTDISKNEEGCLTDAQFEEIVQSVLQKPFQESLEYSGKRFTLVESDDEESLGRETLKTFPTTKDAVPGKASQCKDEKPGADNGGRKENRKGVPKKKVQGNAYITVDQEEMQEEKEADRGSASSWCTAWVQCSYPTCEKWRRLSSDTDPSVLPDDWTCSQNPDLQHSSCSIPEETWSGSENEMVYAVYIPGSIVWAKQYGYPWWPGMVEADPDIGEYFLFTSQKDSLPSKYHVTFFGDTATRAWISASMLRNFDDPEMVGFCLRKTKGDKKKLETAVRMAEEAEKRSLQERIKKFGFDNRFGGKESPNDQQDSKDVMCKPCAKRTLNPGGRNKMRTLEKNQEKKTTNVKGHKKSKQTTEGSFSLSKKSRQEVSPPTGAAVSKGAGKGRGHRGFKKSFAVPLSRNPGSCTYIGGNPSKKDSLKKVKASRVADIYRQLFANIREIKSFPHKFE